MPPPAFFLFFLVVVQALLFFQSGGQPLPSHVSCSRGDEDRLQKRGKRERDSAAVPYRAPIFRRHAALTASRTQDSHFGKSESPRTGSGLTRRAGFCAASPATARKEICRGRLRAFGSDPRFADLRRLNLLSEPHGYCLQAVFVIFPSVYPIVSSKKGVGWIERSRLV